MSKIGGIYAHYSEEYDFWIAIQVIKPYGEGDKDKEKTGLVVLDFAQKIKPSEKDFENVKPFCPDFYFWNGEIKSGFYDNDIPKDYIFITNKKPIVENIESSYAGFSTIAYEVKRQKEWEALPKKITSDLKEAAKEREKKIKIEGDDYPIGRTNIFISRQNKEIKDMMSLIALPCLYEVECEYMPKNLIKLLEEKKLISKLILKEHNEEELDFSKTHLEELRIEAKGLKRLVLNERLKTLAFFGVVDKNIEIVKSNGVKYMRLEIEEKITSIKDMLEIMELQINKCQEINLNDIAKFYPNIKILNIWCGFGNISGIKNFIGLPKLQTLWMFDAFGFDDGDFPPPEKLPLLNYIRFSSVPIEVIQKVKTLYKNQIEKDNMYLSKGRSKEWLSINLDNPFHSWDGRDGIPASKAKKAFEIYKTLKKEIIEIAKDKKDIEQKLGNAVKEFTESFNAINKRSDFIETVEREEIYEILLHLLKEREKDFDGKMNIEKLINEIFDEARDW